jgi:dTDP-4-amino-4,6-dideoxygalactose transaminase
VSNIEKAITLKTKVIMPVDFAGYPCDYNEINALPNKYKHLFVATHENQRKLGRMLILSDSAHSFGGSYDGKKCGSLTDVSVFSFHAVKNLSTAEGGAVALNLPEPFDNNEVYSYLCMYTLHGQNKDALAKTQKGNWKYDIIEAGYKCNMTDLSAAIGLIELDRYDNDTQIKRKEIFETYNKAFSSDARFQIPMHVTDIKNGCYHLYPLRINTISEEQRDAIMKEIFDCDFSVNVHFMPVPATSFYKNLGYDIKNYPVTYDNFSREISLPIYYNLSSENIQTVIQAVIQSVNKVLC